MTSEKATEITTLHRALDSLRASIRTLVPAVVVSYQEAGPFGPVAECQPTRMGADSAGVPYALPRIPNCPVLWPRAGGMAIWGTLLPGDEVMLGIADRSLDEFMLRTPASPPMPPGDHRMHSLSDAVVILGLSSASNALPPAAGSFRVGREDGTATVRITMVGPGEVEIEALSIKLGATAVYHPAQAELLTTWLTALNTAWVVVPADGGAALKTALTAALASLPSAIATVKVSAE